MLKILQLAMRECCQI